MKRHKRIPIRLYMRVKLEGTDSEQWAGKAITRHVRRVGQNQVKINRTIYAVTVDQQWAILEWNHKGQRRQTYRMPLVDWSVLRALNPVTEVTSP